MKRVKTLAVLNLIFLLMHIAVAYATQFRFINQPDVGEVSDKYGSLFVPAGYTFSIWGLIYTSLIALCIRQLVFAFSSNNNHLPANEDTRRIGSWLIINNILSISWLYAWTHGYILSSVILICCMLITLVVMNLKLHIHDPFRGPGSKILTQFPLSIYFGWITVATIANISALLISVGWDRSGYPDVLWTNIMIAAAVIINLLVIFSRRNVFFGIVLIWSLWGIIDKSAGSYPLIGQTAWIGIIIISIACIIRFALNINLSYRLRFKKSGKSKLWPASSHPIK